MENSADKVGDKQTSRKYLKACDRKYEHLYFLLPLKEIEYNQS